MLTFADNNLLYFTTCIVQGILINNTFFLIKPYKQDMMVIKQKILQCLTIAHPAMHRY